MTDKLGTDDPRCPACKKEVTENEDDVWDLAVKPRSLSEQTPTALGASTYQPLFVKMNPSNDANLCTKDLWGRNMRQSVKLRDATKFVVAALVRDNNKLRYQLAGLHQHLQQAKSIHTQLQQENNRH